MQIAVVGSGYVGLVAGACFADLGHDVILVDNDERKLAALKRGQVPIHENFLPELLSRHREHRLTFSDNLHEAVRASAVIFVAVGTPPTERGEADCAGAYGEPLPEEGSSAFPDCCTPEDRCRTSRRSSSDCSRDRFDQSLRG